jgi:hypothetical protein
MANPGKHTVTKGEGSGWVLKDDQTDNTFRTKPNAKKGRAVKSLLGTEAGSVRLEKERGGFDQERQYPRSRDPKVEGITVPLHLRNNLR